MAVRDSPQSLVNTDTDRPNCTICEQDESQQVEAIAQAPVNGTSLDLCQNHLWRSDNRLAESRYDGPTEITGESTHEPRKIDGRPTVSPPAEDGPTNNRVYCPACGASRQTIPNAEYDVFCEVCHQSFTITPHEDFSWTRAYRGVTQE